MAKNRQKFDFRVLKVRYLTPQHLDSKGMKSHGGTTFYHLTKCSNVIDRKCVLELSAICDIQEEVNTNA